MQYIEHLCTPLPAVSANHVAVFTSRDGKNNTRMVELLIKCPEEESGMVMDKPANIIPICAMLAEAVPTVLVVYVPALVSTSADKPANR